MNGTPAQTVVPEVTPIEGGKSRRSKSRRHRMHGGEVKTDAPSPIANLLAELEAGRRRSRSKRRMYGGAAESAVAEIEAGKRRRSRSKRRMHGGAAETVAAVAETSALEAGKRRRSRSKRRMHGGAAETAAAVAEAAQLEAGKRRKRSKSKSRYVRGGEAAEVPAVEAAPIEAGAVVAEATPVEVEAGARGRKKLGRYCPEGFETRSKKHRGKCARRSYRMPTGTGGKRGKSLCPTGYHRSDNKAMLRKGKACVTTQYADAVRPTSKYVRKAGAPVMVEAPSGRLVSPKKLSKMMKSKSKSKSKSKTVRRSARLARK